MSSRDMNTVEKRYGDYATHVMAKNSNEIAEYIYPPFFNYIPKEKLIKLLNEGYQDPEMEVEIMDMQPGLFFETLEVENKRYLLFTSNAEIRIRISNSAHSSKKERLKARGEMMFESLKKQHGDEQVKYDISANTILVNSTNYILAISEDHKRMLWHFLEVKHNLLDMYEKFLPGPIVRLLRKLFHPPQEEVIQDELEEYSLDRKKSRIEEPADEKPGEKRIYLTGWEVIFDGGQHCLDFMATHVTDRETAQTASSAIELVFLNDRLIRSYSWEDGERNERPLQANEQGFEYKEYTQNKYFQLIEAPKGKHVLGGEIPNGFVLPPSDCVVSFQYLGCINNTDPNFSWLPFPVHLTCPVYLNFEHLFLDYTDPFKPIIVNKDEIESADTSYEKEMDRNSVVIYTATACDFIEAKAVTQPGQAGMPDWIQYPDIPRCPKTGNLMKFVCQLNGGIPVKRTNVKPENEYYTQYFESMNFWCDGDLYVFFEPSSKIACYLIQNT